MNFPPHPPPASMAPEEGWEGNGIPSCFIPRLFLFVPRLFLLVPHLSLLAPHPSRLSPRSRSAFSYVAPLASRFSPRSFSLMKTTRRPVRSTGAKSQSQSGEFPFTLERERERETWMNVGHNEWIAWVYKPTAFSLRVWECWIAWMGGWMRAWMSIMSICLRDWEADCRSSMNACWIAALYELLIWNSS